MRTVVASVLILGLSASAFGADSGSIAVHKQSRVEDAAGKWQIKQATESWQPSEAAIMVCDMWDSHHCLNAVRRGVEVAPRMNEVLKMARGKGALIIHAPSSCMEPYQNHPGRKLAQSAPKAANLPAQ